MKNVLGPLSLLFLLAVWLYAQNAQSQTFGTEPSVLIPDEQDPIPEELSLLEQIPEPEPDIDYERLPEEPSDQESSERATSPEPEEEFFDLPAFVESSESWLPGGAWFFEGDVVFLQRNIFEDHLLVTDATVGSDRQLILSAGQTNMSTNMRVTLGRYLFRDKNNCEHSISASYLGLGEWVATGLIESVSDNALVSVIDPFIGGFNLSDIQTFRYEIGFDSIEVNYRIRRRLRKDQLVLGPSGHWKQQAAVENLYSVLAGVRFVSTNEQLDYRSESTIPALRRGSMLIRTDNNLAGFQFGGDLTHHHHAFSIGVEGKVGAYVNFAQERVKLKTVDPTLLEVDRDIDIKRRALAFVGDLKVMGEYQICPHFKCRVAWEGLWLNAVAVAPDQLYFSRGSATQINIGGAEFITGMSLGFEATW